jgi:hypothetical protein
MRSTRWITKNLIYGFRVLSVSLLMLVMVGFLHAEGSDRTIGQFVHTAWSGEGRRARQCLRSRADNGRVLVARDYAGPLPV